MTEPTMTEMPENSSPTAAEPSPPASAETPAKPTRRDFDAEIEKQLEEAMAGMDVKTLHGEGGGKKKRKHGPPDTGPKKARVVAWHGDDVFVDYGARTQGVVPRAHFPDFPDGRPPINTEVDVIITGYDRNNGLQLCARVGYAEAVDWSTVSKGQVVEARVTAVNKGGLEVVVNGIRGFLPASQVDLNRVEDLQAFVNQRINCIVTDVNPAERNLVVSRRALLEKERAEAKERLWAELAEGQVRTGTVRSIRDYGAFVDLGGVDGMIHVSDLSWHRVEKPEQVVQVGQTVQVKILKIDPNTRKISLGLKQLQEDPWAALESRFPPGSLVTGKVTRLVDFGAFVELEPGIEGLVHVSELSHQHVRRPADVVHAGQEVQVRVLKVDPTQKRISLSLKAATEAPPSEQPQKPPKQRKGTPPHLKKPLKGGLG
ncbi:MAG: S1 RNA-binding domain-containing protein [Gemmatales bacterium]|nr:S1 RNA-binding domain-containing protein [Gemmatales bacterium]MDW8387636.1 S1 RNA-binding domain-containing protein [Gemmatales bacterium]